MTQPCKRHKYGQVTGFAVVSNDEKTHWAVGEQRLCVHCAHKGVRLARGTIKRTPEDSLRAYGLTAAELERYMTANFPSRGEPVAAPITCWPFPVSAHVDPA